ncbi:MAG TPA: hypothetical protein VFR67_10555 [Pilimelia sp.]|nr:hypothetical protein [Pilimelia sp.]
MNKFITGLATVALVVTTAACGGDDGGPSATPTSPPQPPTVTATPAVPTPSAPGGGGTGQMATPRPVVTWTSGPTTVRHDVPVPPVPRITGVRSAAHPDEGFDRIVFDIAGRIPGYQIRYVDEPIQDPSGRPANVPGRRFLQIRLEPAQAHTDGGQATQPRARTVNYPMLEAWAITGDFEGVVTVVLGLDDVVGYRVGELPGRIYIDVAA